MPSSDFWRDLAIQFRALPDPLGTLRADWHYTTGKALVEPWTLAGGSSPNLRTQFQALARRAGSQLRHSNSSNLLFAWLDALKANSPNFEFGRLGMERNADGSEGDHHMSGCIYHVCEASASHCNVLESQALESEFAVKSKQQGPELEILVSAPVSRSDQVINLLKK